MGSLTCCMVHNMHIGKSYSTLKVLKVKIILFVIQLYFSEDLELMGEFFLSDFKGSPKLELIFVMVIVPLTFNSIQVIYYILLKLLVLDLR